MYIYVYACIKRLFVKNISPSLQKFCQYNKNLTKDPTKINTITNTN